MATPPDPKIITQLGYDPTDNKKGLKQALADAAEYRAKVLLIGQELKREQAKLITEFSAENRKQVEDRIKQLGREQAAAASAIGSRRGAEKKAATEREVEIRKEIASQQSLLKSFDDQKRKVDELGRAQQDAIAKQKAAQAAAGLFRESGRISGEIPGFGELLGGISPNLVNIQQRLNGILGAIARLGGGIKGASQGFDALAASGAAAAGGSEALASAMAAVLNPITLVGAAVGVTGAAMLKAGLSAGEWADKLVELGQMSGLTADQLQKLEFVGRSTRLDIDTMVQAMRGLSKAVDENDPAFKKLGISTRTADGGFRDLFDVLLDVADAVQRAGSQTEKLRIAQETLGGRVGARLLPTLVLGRKGLQAMFDEVDKHGVKSIEELAERFDEGEKASARLEMAFHNLEARMGFTIGLWNTLKNAVAEYIEVGNQAERDINSGKFTPLDGAIPIQVANPNAPPPSPRAPEVPWDLYQLYGTAAGTARNRAPEGPDVITAREKVNAAQQKQLTVMQQLQASQAKLNKLKEEEKDLYVFVTSEGKNPQLVTNLEQQASLIAQINQLNATRAQQEKQIADLQKDIAGETEARTRQIAQRKFAESMGEQTAAQIRSEGIRIIELPRLQEQAQTLQGDALKENLEKQKALLSELRTLDQARLQITEQAKKARENELDLLNKQRLKLADLAAAQGQEEPKLFDASVFDTEWQKKNNVGKVLPPSQTAEFFKGLKEFSDIVGKFDSGLNKNLVQLLAIIDGMKVVSQQLENLSGEKGRTGFLKGIKALFSGENAQGQKVGIGERLSTALGLAGVTIGGISQLSGAFNAQNGTQGFLSGLSGGSSLGMLVGGPVGGAIGAVVGGIVGLFSGRARKKTANMAADAAAELNQNVGDIQGQIRTGNLSQQIQAAQDGVYRLAKQWEATIRALDGRKGGGEELAKLGPQFQQQIDQLQNQLVQLQQQRQQLLEEFSSQTALLMAPEGVRDITQSLLGIAQTLKTIRDAGGDAGTQMEFLNRSLGNLAATMGRQLRSDEQETIDLLMQEIDLQKEREDVIKQADLDIAAAKRKGGLERALTPAQEAALEIDAIKKKRDEDLQSLDEQAAHLQAQLGARAELFNLDTDRNELLNRQLDIEREITAETVARIAEQKDWYNQIARGVTPELPWGLIPGGSGNFQWNINGATIQVVLPSDAAFTPDEAARIVRDGLTRIGQQQQVGF